MNNTMKLEQQVVSLELAKQLKELGVKQDSLFYWSKQVDQIHWGLEHAKYFAVDKRQDVSAFTVAELGEMLPQNIQIDGMYFTWVSWLSMGGWVVQYEGVEKDDVYDINAQLHEADARAKMLIWLIEEGYITQ